MWSQFVRVTFLAWGHAHFKFHKNGLNAVRERAPLRDLFNRMLRDCGGGSVNVKIANCADLRVVVGGYTLGRLNAPAGRKRFNRIRSLICASVMCGTNMSLSSTHRSTFLRVYIRRFEFLLQMTAFVRKWRLQCPVRTVLRYTGFNLLASAT